MARFVKAGHGRCDLVRHGAVRLDRVGLGLAGEMRPGVARCDLAGFIKVGSGQVC